MPNKPDRNEIYNAMQFKDSEELLSIWQDNDHVSWHDEVFEVVREILEDREEIIPEQNQAITDESQRKKTGKIREFLLQMNTEKPKFNTDEEQPVFYDPQEVLRFEGKIKYIAYALIGSSFISTLLILPEYVSNLLSLFPAQGYLVFIIWMIVIIGLLIILVAQAAFIFYFFNLFGKIILILMEMEFSSRRRRN